MPDDASRPGEHAHPDRPKTVQTLFGPLELRRTYYYHAATHGRKTPVSEFGFAPHFLVWNVCVTNMLRP